MKIINITLGLATSALMAACSPKPSSEAAPTAPRTALAVPDSSPKPTPHPAVTAREQAIKLFPELAKKGSTFNKAFVELYNERAKTDPDSLASVDWPLALAQQVGSMLAVPQKPVAAEEAPMPTPSWFEQRRAAAKDTLGQPAHDQKRALYYHDSVGRVYYIDPAGYRHYGK